MFWGTGDDSVFVVISVPEDGAGGDSSHFLLVELDLTNGGTRAVGRSEFRPFHAEEGMVFSWTQTDLGDLELLTTVVEDT